MSVEDFFKQYRPGGQSGKDEEKRCEKCGSRLRLEKYCDRVCALILEGGTLKTEFKGDIGFKEIKYCPCCGGPLYVAWGCPECNDSEGLSKEELDMLGIEEVSDEERIRGF